jgi:hypothetical protein
MPSPTARLACLLLLAAAAGGAQAEKVYRWTDAQGKAHYSDRPQGRAQLIDVKPGSGPGTPGGAESDSPGRESAGSARNAAECERRRGQLDTYRRAERIVEKDSLGNEREYGAGDRDKLIRLTEQSMRDACGEPG